MAELDLLDKRIIYELERNCKISISNIAKKLKVSKQRVSYRIKNLELNRFILGYSCILDTSKLGYTTYRIYIKFQNTSKEDKIKIIKDICSYNNIPQAIAIDNIWDFAFGIVVKVTPDFHKVWVDILKKYKENIDKYHISICAPIYSYTRDFLNPDTITEPPKLRVFGDCEKVDYDKNDIIILKELAKNIRRPIVEIAQSINRNPQFIINRIKELEKKEIIKGYKPDLDWNKFGYTYYKIFINLSNFKKYNEMFKYCESNLQIFQIYKTIGGWDLEIEIYAKNLVDFKKIMSELQDKFNDCIKNYFYFTVGNIHKEIVVPFE